MFEPIIDRAQRPIHSWRASPTPGNTIRVLWLAVVRPVLLLLTWLFVLDYFYWEFIRATAASPTDARFLRLCAIAIIVLFAVMIFLAYLVRNSGVRRGVRVRNRKAVPPLDPTPPEVLAEASQVPFAALLRWQRARRMVVTHDDDGQFKEVLVQPDVKPGGPAA